LHPAARNLADALGTQTDKAKGRFQVGNAVWVQQHFGLADTFRTLVRTHYAAEVREVDFMDEAEAARNTINQWVAGKTADKIPTLLGDHALAADTRLVLTSTLYLKADWLERFSQGDTADGIFHLADGKTVTVPLMQGLRLAPYFDEGTYEALALPFDGKRLSMVVLLPKMKHGLGQLEKALSGEQLTRVLARLRPASVEVALPRFSVAGKADLAKALTALGLGRAFSNADFSGIATAERLSLDKLIHEVHVDVNEEGVEASAATAVPVKRRSLTGSSDRTFRADRPFLFLIRDDPTGCLLFLGRVADPQKP
jgi:serpin B